jgi:ssDNA-binding Zn-finger/Zn-ribbon topoisomerase 1
MSEPVHTNETLGDLPSEYTLHFHCQNAPTCHFNKPMDLQQLIGSLGKGLKVSELDKVLRCPKCKSKNVRSHLSPATKEYSR